ncbi:MAG: FAD-dependent oxidoreductase [Hyphomonadaceae bacterium]|nr:FAD-dependent oxidoreductase [Hyphomonadaceae bacterium]
MQKITNIPGADRVDVAIVGAGAAGLYCALRLGRERPDLSVEIFEAGPEVGGRWRSATAGDGAVCELGAAFVSNQHTTTLALARELGCAIAPVDFASAGYFLRGRWLQAGEPALPFLMRAEEHRLGASALIERALAASAPEFSEARAAADGQGALNDVEGILRTAVIEGRPLWRWPMRTLLERTLSNEALAFAERSHGSTAAFAQINAYDASLVHLLETRAGQRYGRVHAGFGALARKMAERAGCAIHMGHRLCAVGFDGALMHLSFSTPDGERRLRATSLILALAPSQVEAVRFETGLVGPAFAADLASLVTIPACKLFLEFAQRWRPAVLAAPSDAIAAVHTDLPLQQCYFAPSGVSMLAAFADGAGAHYWRALADKGADAPAPMIEAAMRQLEALYGSVPAPVSGRFVFWPAAWHAWAPGARSWQARARLVQPNPNLRIFLCGEAYAREQGWSEGALNNAEAMLERGFGLGRPCWAGDHDPFDCQGDA